MNISIYDVRPVQCSTYPFWPSLLKNKQSWEEESVLPDDIDIRVGTNDRHWSSEMGGCEGIRIDNNDIIDTVDDEKSASADDKNVESVIQRQEIVSKMKAAKKHWKRFPVQEIKESTWYL